MKSIPLSGALCLLACAWPALVEAEEKDPAKSQLKTNPTAPSVVSEVGGKTFDQWKQDLKHPDPSVRAEAIIAISQFGAATVDAVPLLLDRCLDRDASPRVKAVIALTFIEIAEKDIPKVIDTLALRVGDDTQSIVRYQAATALNLRFADHKHARNAVSGLLKGAADQAAWEIRRACVMALRRCGVDPANGPEPRVTQALVRALQDPTSRVRAEAAIGLGAMGRPGDEILLGQVLRALQGVLRDREKSVGIWAQVSLMALADKVSDSQLETLAKGLSSSDMRIRAQTTRAIGALRERGQPCVGALLTALQDKEREVILEACVSLGNVGDRGPKVVAALTELSKSKDAADEVRELAKMTLEQLTKPKDKKK